MGDDEFDETLDQGDDQLPEELHGVKPDNYSQVEDDHDDLPDDHPDAKDDA